MTMRIENIKLQNYRQFKELEITFNRKYDNDLHFAIGRNGTGKTNLLNAINWCLYNEEPHLSKTSKQLPILNLNSIKKAEDGDDIELMIEVQFSAENKKYIIFSRRAVYTIHKSEKEPSHQLTEFEAKVTDDKGNTELLNADDAISYVERIVPRGIREFFFFDGERLDNYFREATAQNIRHAIIVISQIELIENKIEPRLEDILKEFRREAGKLNPEIEETRYKLESANEQLENVDKQIENCRIQIKTANEGLRKIDSKLKGTPDLEEGNKEILKLKTSINHNKELRKRKIKDKQNLLFEFAIILRLWPVIEKSIEIIRKKKKNKEIPPIAHPILLENILKDKVCNICGTPLNTKSESRVKELLQEIKLSSDISLQLTNMENPLLIYRDKIKQFKEKMKTLNDDITYYEKELEKMEKRKGLIEKNQIGYAPEKIKELYNQKKSFEEQSGKNHRSLGVLEEKKKNLQKDIDALHKRFTDEITREKRSKELIKKISFCERSLYVVRKTKEFIMKKTKEKIESETKKLFFQLIWKKETFHDINISDDYDIDLIHSMGYSCLGSISAAERELLALSFTIALHKISGFDAPILIDTPVARVSDESRENLGNIFSEVSNNKQIILLFTPAEYSKEIRKSLDIRGNSKYLFKLSSDENEVKLEVI